MSCRPEIVWPLPSDGKAQSERSEVSYRAAARPLLNPVKPTGGFVARARPHLEKLVIHQLEKGYNSVDSPTLTPVAASRSSQASLSPETRLKLYRTMQECRMLEKRAYDEALARACAAGALAASRHGAQPSLPTAAEVDGLLAL